MHRSAIHEPNGSNHAEGNSMSLLRKVIIPYPAGFFNLADEYPIKTERAVNLLHKFPRFT